VDLSPEDERADPLLQPERLVARAEVLGRPCPVPAAPGVYAWYFDEPPPGVPVDACHCLGDHFLLYVGISPKAPAKAGGRPSGQSLRTRVRYHYGGNAEGSTLRLTLGSLLSESLGIQLRRVGGGKRLTFSEGESALSGWMDQHARVCWVVTERPWLLESRLIEQLTLPLNLDQNLNGSFRARLSEARARQRARARELPVVPR
jgi:hypothetical protein